jgi:hypothetical protein
MGLAYTVDSPIKVARYGIDSVISIIEDKLIELMRQHYYKQLKRPFTPIMPTEEDFRAKRITDYLNLVNQIVKEQIDSLKNTAFLAGSELSKYFEMLPTQNVLRIAYNRLMTSSVEKEKEALTKFLTSQVRPGRIDVNIMTKVDKNHYDQNNDPVPDSSDALAALRGYANSDLTNSAIIFSAGLNPRLFNYLEKLRGFDVRADGTFDKKIIIKVSDYRSALIQGKYLAKKGIWVSEFRVESGLNCGGHAFATDGSLMGLILREFKEKRSELVSSLHALYNASVKSKGGIYFEDPHPIAITVQGGIGTHEEAEFLLTEYDVTSTGWGTPFLLCPEATTVDGPTQELLRDAEEKDIILSRNSPLGVRFNYLRGTSSEKEKLARIAKGKPGSPCTEKHLVSNTEFTKEPICTASHAYQKRKIEQLKTMDLSPTEFSRQYDHVVSKECLCIGLSNAASIKYDLPLVKNLKAVTICPGPNIAYFNRIVSLREMTDHIYGRGNVLSNLERPHMFIKELRLNVQYMKEQAHELNEDDAKRSKEIVEFGSQLLAGIRYYRGIEHASLQKNQFQNELDEQEKIIKGIQNEILTAPKSPLEDFSGTRSVASVHL